MAVEGSAQPSAGGLSPLSANANNLIPARGRDPGGPIHLACSGHTATICHQGLARRPPLHCGPLPHVLGTAPWCQQVLVVFQEEGLSAGPGLAENRRAVVWGTQSVLYGRCSPEGRGVQGRGASVQGAGEWALSNPHCSGASLQAARLLPAVCGDGAGIGGGQSDTGLRTALPHPCLPHAMWPHWSRAPRWPQAYLLNAASLLG